MRIGIIGTDELGLTLAELWARAGHQVLLAPGAEELSAELVDRLSESFIEVAATDDAARTTEVVALTGPFAKTDAMPTPLAVAGKVVIDAMNAGPEDDPGASSSEITAERFPQARYV